MFFEKKFEWSSLWGQEKISKNVYFTLRGHHATMSTHNISCTNFPFLAHCVTTIYYCHCCLFFPRTNCLFQKKLGKKFFFLDFLRHFFSNVLMIARHEVWLDTLTAEKVCIKFYNDQDKYSTVYFNNHLMWCVFCNNVGELTVVYHRLSAMMSLQRAQSFTSLMADLHQDIKSVFFFI